MDGLTTLHGIVIVAGAAAGVAIVTDEPISFWGGLDPDSGEIIDRRHLLSGQNVAGMVLVLPHGRGSCSASGVLLEAIRNDLAPAAIVVSRIDPIIGLGSILGDELYAKPVPVIQLDPELRRSIVAGDYVEIDATGRLTVRRSASR